MRYFSFEIVIEKESEDEGYLAYSPTLPGCFSNGQTIEQTSAICARPSNNIWSHCSSTGSRFPRTNSWSMSRS